MFPRFPQRCADERRRCYLYPITETVFLLLRKEEENLPFASEWHDEFIFPRFPQRFAEDAICTQLQRSFFTTEKRRWRLYFASEWRDELEFQRFPQRCADGRRDRLICPEDRTCPVNPLRTSFFTVIDHTTTAVILIRVSGVPAEVR
jgi:hypothetical protein